MLAKLFKYEFKATSRLIVPMYLIMLFMSLINRFTFNIDKNGGAGEVISQFLMLTYVTTIVAVLIVTVSYMIVRFYKNLLTDEGYLMFTLPVKSHQHITSKLMITIFWTIVSIAAVLISLFITFATPATLPSAGRVLREVLLSFNKDFSVNGSLVAVEMLIMFVLGLISNILLIYLSIALGQLFTRHKIIGSFAAYMIVYTVLQFLAVALLIPFGLFMSKTPPSISFIPQVIFPISIVILAAGSVVFYLGTNYIFKKKLNLD